ncbi:MAG: M1 family aminopeptidase [Chitinophagales bacterium]
MKKVIAKSTNAFADMEKYDIIHQKLDLEIGNTSIYVIGTTTFTARSLEAMDIFVCELDINLTVSEVKYNGATTTFQHIGAQELQVNLPTTSNVDDIFTIEISYEGLPLNGAGGNNDFGIFNDTSPSWGAQATWTLSEPYAAHTWFPCKQVLTDKLDSLEVHITTDNALMAGSNGVLHNVVDLGNGKTRYEWKSNYPIAYYLVSIAVAPYIDYSYKVKPAGATDSILIQNFIYDNPATLTNFEADILETGDMMLLFSDLYGMYPFVEEKYGHCMAPLSGGMEHQTMTTQGFFTPWLTAHELGHQWWGNQVTCTDWADIWINEGFASYSEYLYAQSISQTQADSDMQGVHDNVMSAPNGSVYVDDVNDPDRIFSSRLTYDKGNALVHMIRHWFNDDDLFFAALQDFQDIYSMQTATGEDFKEVISSATGYDFTTYFDHWYYGEGFPTINAEYNSFNPTLAVLNITQTGSMANTPFFETFLEVTINFDNFTDTTVRLFNHLPEQNWLFDTEAEITSIEIDPNNWILNQSTVTQNSGLSYDPSLVGNDSPDTIVVVPPPVSVVELENNVSIYPNPTKDVLHIEWEEDIFLTINVYDATGRKMDVAYSHEDITIYTDTWIDGIYFVEIFDGKNRVTKKIVKN